MPTTKDCTAEAVRNRTEAPIEAALVYATALEALAGNTYDEAFLGFLRQRVAPLLPNGTTDFADDLRARLAEYAEGEDWAAEQPGFAGWWITAAPASFARAEQEFHAARWHAAARAVMARAPAPHDADSEYLREAWSRVRPAAAATQEAA